MSFSGQSDLGVSNAHYVTFCVVCTYDRKFVFRVNRTKRLTQSTYVCRSGTEWRCWQRSS
jgi:hypothetical protein